MLLRQAASPEPFDGKDPDVVRTYRVPWVGSSHPCPRGASSSVKGVIFWNGLGGPIMAGVSLLGVVGLARRVRRAMSPAS